MPRQLLLPSIRRATREHILDYVGAHASAYARHAERIYPDHHDDSATYTRVAFAILSANVPFESAVKALAYAHAAHWAPDPFALSALGMVPAKAHYLRQMVERPASWYLRHEPDWHSYRLRLRTVRGLGLAKASFAASLLYPTEADVACLDTWMQKVIYGHQSFHDLSLSSYLHGEEWVRRIGRRAGTVSTFVAQWAIWDSARGSVTSHDVFPGAHKGTEWLLGA